MQDASSGIADGLRQYSQNQLLTNAALGKVQGAMRANPELEKFMNGATETDQPVPQVSPDVLKAFTKIKSGKANHNDAALASAFVDTYAKQKEEKQQADMRQLQMQAATAQIAEAKRQQEQAVANRAAFQQSMAPIATSPFAAQLGGGVATTRDPTAIEAARRFATAGGVPDQHTNPFFNLMTDAENAAAKNAAGGTPTSAMRDTEAILFSELKSGKLKPVDLEARRGELLAQGGRSPRDTYDNAGTFVDIDTGTNAIPVVKARTGKFGGQFGTVSKDGEFTPIDTKKYKPSTVGDTNPLLDPPEMKKLNDKVIADERSIRQLNRYLGGFENLEQGAGQLADRFTKAVKTVFTKEPLTDQEKAVGIQTGRLEQILGGLRTTVVGPGTMTEIDAKRILDSIGGNVSSLTNPEIVNQLVGEVMMERMREYESDLNLYNTHVVKKYSQAGYSQRSKVPVEFKAATAAPPPVPTAMTAEEIFNNALNAAKK